jgi:hypothetical protein
VRTPSNPPVGVRKADRVRVIRGLGANHGAPGNATMKNMVAPGDRWWRRGESNPSCRASCLDRTRPIFAERDGKGNGSWRGGGRCETGRERGFWRGL